ncbi:MAG: hypothetical protein RI562_09970 [Salibacter sp.]|uniref:hypothetical protein n=1 Tax=Salibacter sp. TaxID=2010995 RepID=UPI0028709D2B|nr:hypothetical protein [Salibacter sp.]MDR9399377.1 hypothetical protein [Salibacter sp.]
MPTQVEDIRKSIIDKILTIDDYRLLESLDNLLKASKVELTDEQIEILQISLNNIEKEDLIDQKDLLTEERKVFQKNKMVSRCQQTTKKYS